MRTGVHPSELWLYTTVAVSVTKGGRHDSISTFSVIGIGSEWDICLDNQQNLQTQTHKGKNNFRILVCYRSRVRNTSQRDTQLSLADE